MRAAIVHGEYAALVVNDEDWAAPAANHHPPLRLQLLDRPGADEIVLSLTHHKAPLPSTGPYPKDGRHGSAAKTRGQKLTLVAEDSGTSERIRWRISSRREPLRIDDDVGAILRLASQVHSSLFSMVDEVQLGIRTEPRWHLLHRRRAGTMPTILQVPLTHGVIGRAPAHSGAALR
jgi:hypothetical protein